MSVLPDWYDGKCMAVISNKNENRRCSIKVKNKDFCHIHVKNKIYYEERLNDIKNNDINNLNINLDSIQKDINNIVQNFYIQDFISKLNKKYETIENYNYTLMDLHESWDELNISDIILIDNEYWSLHIMVNIMTFCLNNSNMENPYPTYPQNPFTRKLLTVNSINKIKNKLLKLKREVHLSLKIFLSQPSSKIKMFYDEASKSHDGHCPKINDIFKNKLRFMIINSKNSQDLYTGMWVTKNLPLTEFEVLYKTTRETPYQIFFNNIIIENPRRIRLQHILSSYSGNYYDLFDKKFYDVL